MIFIIIGIIIGLIWEADNYGVPGAISGAVFGGIAGGIVLVLVTLLGALVGFVPAQPIEATTSEYELAQIKDNTFADTGGEMHGILFLIRGYINTDLAAGFSYYKKEGDGYQLKTASADQSTVKYTKETPKVVISETHCVRSNPKGVAIGLWAMEWCKEGSDSIHYTFYIPEGSIKESYNLGE